MQCMRVRLPLERRPFGVRAVHRDQQLHIELHVHERIGFSVHPMRRRHLSPRRADWRGRRGHVPDLHGHPRLRVQRELHERVEFAMHAMRERQVSPQWRRGHLPGLQRPRGLRRRGDVHECQ